MLQCLWHAAVEQLRGEDPQQGAPVPEEDVLAHPLADRDPHAQLFLALAYERLDVRLARLDLAARKLPHTGHFGRIRSSTRQNLPVYDDRGADDDPLVNPFGLHGRPAFQINKEFGCLSRPVGHQKTEMWAWTHQPVSGKTGGHRTMTRWRRFGHKPATTPGRCGICVLCGEAGLAVTTSATP
ncbi:hypothetical protein Psuf_024870 [Phytohabitans suffuscus]|uniref:Uncharacterized protein n=1 Tax=Phytohabitans suffuscus TaxID=624315 RepID=A0A6F8YGA5_9ACTN|nr:hypothetical protein Psuf_024870 [Phytohabitans suffuscus]